PGCAVKTGRLPTRCSTEARSPAAPGAERNIEERRRMAEPVRKPLPDQDTEPESEREPRLIGKPFRRVDGRAKVTGATRFADDLTFPRMCWLRLVRSTVPHALIKRIDFTEAEKVPGVLGFLTGKDFPVTFGILPVSQDEHALCPD